MTFVLKHDKLTHEVVRSSFTTKVFADPAADEMITQLHPFRGVGMPEDVAGIAVFLASDDARWVSGQPIVVDGAYTAQ